MINWYVLQTAKAHFSYTIWSMISKKSTTRCKFIRCVKSLSKTYKGIMYLNFQFGLVAFIDMNIYALTEGRKAGISKYSWKQVMQLPKILCLVDYKTIFPRFNNVYITHTHTHTHTYIYIYIYISIYYIYIYIQYKYAIHIYIWNYNLGLCSKNPIFHIFSWTGKNWEVQLGQY